MKKTLFFILVLGFVGSAFSQVARVLFLEKITLDGNNMISSSNLDLASDGDITLNLPKSGPFQKLLDRKFSVEPFNLSDKGDYIQAKWYLRNVLPEREIRIETAMLISTQDKAQSSIFDDDDQNTEKYLKEEKNFPYKSKQIQDLASQIVARDTDKLLDSIMVHGYNALPLPSENTEHEGLLKAIKKGKGDYIHYAEIMVALCRAKGIPARVVCGFQMGSQLNVDYWFEAYINGRGWVRKHPFPFSVEENFKGEVRYVAVLYDELRIRKFTINKGMSWKISSQKLYSTESIHQEAMKSYQNQEIEKSDSLFRILINEIPIYYKYYNMLGVTRARQGQFENALGLLQQAMNLSKTEEEKCFTYYAFAKYAALKNEAKMAAKYLDLVLKKGCVSLDGIKKDPDLQKTGQSEELLALIKAHEKQNAQPPAESKQRN